MNAVSQPRLTDDQIHAIVADLERRGVTSIIGTFIDNAGVARAKQVPLDRLRAFHVNGVGASYSWAVFAVDDALPLTYISVPAIKKIPNSSVSVKDR